MKRILLSAAIGALLAVSANADQMWVDTINYTNPVYVGWWGSTSDTFDITSDGFEPFVDVATNAAATFVFSDDGGFMDSGESYIVSLGLIPLPVIGSTWQTTLTLDFADVLTEVALLFELNLTGAIDFTITSTWGDFYLRSAELTATGPDRCGVPDGGMTLALLGLGLLGIVAARRKLG